MHQRVVLDVQDIRKNYGADEVLRGVSFQVAEGDVLCILGPSGAGKSTLLRCINYLEQPSSGTVRVDRELIGYRLRRGRLHALRPGQIARQRQSIGMVFQHFNLFPHLTVTGNISAAPMHVLGLDRKAATERAMQALAEVGLTDKAGAYPRQLSGGQQQRVAIARALAMRPRLIMLDEPTSALDPELVGEVLDVMLRLAAEGITMVVVTHELGFARRAAGEVMLIDGGQVIEHGPAAHVLDRPREERTRSFLSKVL